LICVALRSRVRRAASQSPGSWLSFLGYGDHRGLHSFPTRRSSDLSCMLPLMEVPIFGVMLLTAAPALNTLSWLIVWASACNEKRSEEHTSELQSRENLVCRLLLEKKKRPSVDKTWTRRCAAAQGRR